MVVTNSSYARLAHLRVYNAITYTYANPALLEYITIKHVFHLAQMGACTT